MARCSVADDFAPLFRDVLGPAPGMQIRFWDGSRLGPADSPATVEVLSPHALRRALYAPGELGFGRAYVVGELDIEGDVEFALRTLRRENPHLVISVRAWAQALAAAARHGVLGWPLPRPSREVRLRGRRHSAPRDAAAIARHYDVSNDFYRIALGPSMTYSCARFTLADESLEEAQANKHDLICRKLGLVPGMRLLDVGCGWGGMLLHAAANYGVDAVGITVSRPQYELARKRVSDAGLGSSVDVQLRDYRHLGPEQFDAVSSIGMFEHVGLSRRQEYFDALARALRPGGRLLNHAISSAGGAAFDRRSFVAAYIFPDAELQDISDTLDAAEVSGLEVRDVECLREHYPLTLRRWLDNAEERWDEVMALVGSQWARAWRLHLNGCIVAFGADDISVHQLLAVQRGAGGRSGMPLTRAGLV